MLTIPRKQQSDTAAWERALTELRARPGIEAEARRLVETEAGRVRARQAIFGQCAYAWSGGKDSLVLELVAELAGIHECVLVISELEYPAFLAWATDNMPAGLTVEVRAWGIDWLAGHLDMLFPATAGLAARWFSGVQHWGQRRYVAANRVDTLLLGRRRGDGNYCGKAGADAYRDREGFTRWSPLAGWTNEQVLTVLAGSDRSLPPCYAWARGFRVGTGPWAARQWCGTVENGWAEILAIDPQIVAEAARAIPSAAAALRAG